MGFFAFELAAAGHEVVGVDSNRRLIEICRRLAQTNDFPVAPRFFCDRLDESAILQYGEFDAAICLSVLHHLKEERKSVLSAFATAYPFAFVEMDGRDFGRHELASFYWRIEQVVQCNDRYGAGNRKRLTWLCSNHEQGCQFASLKSRNIVGGRGVFLKRGHGGAVVVKRESLRSSHTWIRTDLRHELQMYRDWSHSRFFAGLLGHGQDANWRWIACQHIEDDGGANASELARFFQFLKDHKLFILDISPDSFLFRDGRLKFVDLESMFPLAGSVRQLIRDRTFRRAIPLDTYDKQLQYLSRRLVK